MAHDYAKKKNDELAALCKERGLPHTGKKADLVKRLEDHDASQQDAASAAAAAPGKPAMEDEIDWDDEPASADANAASSEPAGAAMAAGGVGPVKNPVAVPNQTLIEDPAKTEEENRAAISAAPPSTDIATAPSANNAPVEPTPEEKAPKKDFSQGLADRTLDDEIEKRKARAKRFNLPTDGEELKLLERAKRFGTTTDAASAPGLLNQALSEGKDRKRGRQGEGERERGGSKRTREVGGARPESARPRRDGGVQMSWMSEADRAKAEARKARFAAPS